MNTYLRVAAKIAGHVLILVLCGGIALALSGRFTRSEHTINGVPLERLGVGPSMQALQSGGQITTTTFVFVSGHGVKVDGAVFPVLLWPAATVILLLMTYLLGAFWRAASWLPVRIGIALAPLLIWAV